MSDKVKEKEDVMEGGSSENKKVFTEPKLKFVEPKLTKQGDATKITGQFFGTLNRIIFLLSQMGLRQNVWTQAYPLSFCA